MTVRWVHRVLGFILLSALLLVAPVSMASALASSGDQVCSTTTTTPIATYDPVTSPALDAASSWACEDSNARSVIEPSGPVVAAEVVISAPRAPAVGDDFWRATNVGPNRAGTLVPESFDLAVGGQKFSVHPNATKHMAEYATSHQISNVPISSFAGSVESALAQGLRPGRNFLRVGPWELGIDTNSNVIYHAVNRPG